MKIILTSHAEVLLRAWTFVTQNEFSGLADVIRQNGDLYVMNAHVLDVGSFGFTDFTPEMILTLPRSENRRCWFHRHPINWWSGTDIHTMTYEPCGSIPEMIQWAVSIVWTPKGWLGRLDMFVPTHRFFDLEVVSQGDAKTIEGFAAIYERENNLFQMAETLHAAFAERHKVHRVPDENADNFLDTHNLMTTQAFAEAYNNKWPEPTRVARVYETRRGPAIQHRFWDDAKPAPKHKKTLIQKTFDWLLDKPKED